MRTAFHESIFATLPYHFAQKAIERNGIGGGMFGGVFLSVDVVANSRTKAAFVTETAEQMIEQGGDGCLTIGAGYADELQL